MGQRDVVETSISHHLQGASVRCAISLLITLQSGLTGGRDEAKRMANPYTCLLKKKTLYLVFL
jgi:hypothetical protein